MPYTWTLRGERFVFHDLKELLARASEQKSGDELAGVAARSERERVAAKLALADVRLEEIIARPLIDLDEDDVSRLLLAQYDRERFQAIKGLTVGEFREFLLREETDGPALSALACALTPEVVAA